MKSVIFTLTLITCSTAFANLSSIYCQEGTVPGRDSLKKEAIRIVELRELPRGNFDSQKEVEVQMIRIIRGNAYPYYKFLALSTAEDINYEIHASRKENFTFKLYLDEGVGFLSSTDSSGVISKSKYRCNYEN